MVLALEGWGAGVELLAGGAAPKPYIRSKLMGYAVYLEAEPSEFAERWAQQFAP